MRWAATLVLVVGLFVAGFGAATMRAAPTADPTTGTTPTTSTGTAATTTTATTTTATTTVATTTTASTTTTAATALASAAGPRAARCLAVGAVSVLGPRRSWRVVGPLVRSGAPRHLGLAAVEYPADGSVVTAASLDLSTSGCGHNATGSAVLRSVSLFGGAVTARRVALSGHNAAVAGLEVGGKAVAVVPGRRVPVGVWAYAVPAPPPLSGPGMSKTGGLALHLLAPRAGLRAGTTVLVAFEAVPAPAQVQAAPRPHAKPKQKPKPRPHAKHKRHLNHKRHRNHKSHRNHKRHLTLAQYRHRLEKRGAPLKMTPPLGLKHYVFPVTGQPDYGDTYGAFRGDVPGNWHHGDDLFAAVGTPVVAVANGTLNRVGWEHLGGWRLWVRDSLGNEFYYAHLSGYSPLALHSTHVKAGDVLGFVGNTGDAFTTSPHLHFEVHPHQLLWLHYNGAVDPTSYLDQWPHLSDVRAPKPVHPHFPPGRLRQEASYVWRELLASRGLIRHAPSPSERPKIAVPGMDRSVKIAPLGGPTPPLRSAANGGAGPPTALLVSVPTAMGAALAGVCLVRRRRRNGDGERVDGRVSAAVGRLASLLRSLRARTWA